MEFKENLRSVDVLMIDDLQFLIGKDNTQEEFFHTSITWSNRASKSLSQRTSRRPT